MKGISPNIGHTCTWVHRCTAYILGSKGQGHSRQSPQKPDEYNIFVAIGTNFAKIRSHMYLGQETY